DHDEEEGDHDEEEGDHDEEEGDHDEEEGDHDEEEGDHDEEEGDHDEEEGDHDEEEGDHDEEEGDHDEEEGDHDEEEGDHGHEGAFDPHFWFDPSRMEKAVRLIAAELIEIGKGLSATEWNERATNYIAQIQDAAAEAEELLSAVPEDHRKLVTNHDAFSYFGAFFDFEILDTILSGGSTLAQPGTAHLAELVDKIRAEGVTAIFTETTADDGLPNTVAAEFDPPLQVVELYTGSLGPPGSDADTYPKWLVTNARLIAEAITP
ncbi:MAG: metal ABC transporter substrate-binding protein, partial [bacterium]|nr:metal ABC transporter substrate-binding protein [bacterium]